MKKQLSLMFLSISLIAVTLVLYSAEVDRPGTNTPMSWPHNLNGGGFDNLHMIGGFGFFKLADELEITNPQLLQLRMWFQKNEKIMNAGQERRLLFKKFSDHALSEADVKKIAAAEGKALEESIVARFQMLQDLRKILTPAQFKKLQERKRSSIKGRRGFLHRKGLLKGPEQRASTPWHEK